MKRKLSYKYEIFYEKKIIVQFKFDRLVCCLFFIVQTVNNYCQLRDLNHLSVGACVTLFTIILVNKQAMTSLGCSD